MVPESSEEGSDDPDKEIIAAREALKAAKKRMKAAKKVIKKLRKLGKTKKASQVSVKRKPRRGVNNRERQDELPPSLDARSTSVSGRQGVSQPNHQNDRSSNLLTEPELERYDADMLKVLTHLSKYNLVFKEMASDGNCLFRAISDQLEGDDSKHVFYRRRAVVHILANKTDFVPFINDETIEEYCAKMGRDTVWGGQLELRAMATLFRFNAIIHRCDYPDMA